MRKNNQITIRLEWKYYTIHTAKLTPFKKDRKRKRQMRRLGKYKRCLFTSRVERLHSPAGRILRVFFSSKRNALLLHSSTAPKRAYNAIPAMQ